MNEKEGEKGRYAMKKGKRERQEKNGRRYANGGEVTQERRGEGGIE